MTAYRAPVDDMLFVLKSVAGLHALEDSLGKETASEELTAAVLEEAARFAEEQLAPLNYSGDVEGARLENGVVRTAKGFKEAYQAFAAAGWNGAVFPAEHGGQDLPWTTQMALTELWNAANMSLSVCPLLNQAAIDAVIKWGSDAQKETYLEKLISGQWTAAMCLTEPHAGTDVGALRTKAVPDGDAYRISGTKIYITYGEHDMTDNIVHLVLARLPDAPAGTRGISLFIVPKFIPDESGDAGVRNDMRCVSIEHKLGLKASPTCVMSYGDNDGATGYLIGEPNGGMKAMFTMMNNARIAVGIQGLGIAERAYQQAVAYTKERVQGRIEGKPATLVHYPDMQRRLMMMRTQIAAMRALCYWAGVQLDLEHASNDDATAKTASKRVAILTPIVKAWCTDRAVEIASEALQCHGGMGFVEETGAAQHYRDARILPIYEGTNAVQAIDLIIRKLAHDGGAMINEILTSLTEEMQALNDKELVDALGQLSEVSTTIRGIVEAEGALAAQRAATPYLTLFGYVLAACLLARGAANASGGQADEWTTMLQFFKDQMLPQALANRRSIESASHILPEVA